MLMTVDNLDQLEALIESDFGYKHSGRWGKALEHSSLVVDREKGLWYWNSKGIKGNAFDYLILVRGMARKTAEGLIKPFYSLPKEPEEETHPHLLLVERANKSADRGYWYDRCLTDKTIDRFLLGNDGEWNLLPIFVDGELYNVQLRRDIPEKQIAKKYKGKRPTLFNSSLLKYTDAVVVTEGTVDSILLNQMGIPSVSHDAGNSYWSPEWSPLFNRIKSVYYVADNDNAGVVAARIMCNSLGLNKVKVLRFSDRKEKYDTRDFFKDGGTVKDFLELLQTKSKYFFEGI